MRWWEDTAAALTIASVVFGAVPRPPPPPETPEEKASTKKGAASRKTMSVSHQGNKDASLHKNLKAWLAFVEKKVREGERRICSHRPQRRYYGQKLAQSVVQGTPRGGPHNQTASVEEFQVSSVDLPFSPLPRIRAACCTHATF